MEKKHKSIVETITYAYIRRIKKWMFCPNCQKGKMSIDKKSTVWACEECGYKLSADEFEDDYVFWFCDECNTYLNNQEGFDRYASRHICTKCGYENDTTFDNIKGTCSDCGKLLPDHDTTLCVGCKFARKQKARKPPARLLGRRQQLQVRFILHHKHLETMRKQVIFLSPTETTMTAN